MNLFLATSLIAQEAGEQSPMRDTGLWQTITMVLIVVVFFYFILWRPEQKRRKIMEDLRTGLKKGDRVTAMGILGTVSRVEDQTVVLKMIDGSKIEFLKGAITDVIPADIEEARKAESETQK